MPCADVSKVHEINLSVPMLEVPPKTMNVTVYQCLPHRNPEDPYPWPYNNTPEAYLSSHTCCSLGGRYNATKVRLVDNALTVYNGYGNKLDEIIVYDPSGNEVRRETYTPPTGEITALTPSYSLYTRETTPEAAIAETGITVSITKESITIVFPSGTENIEAYTVEEVAKEPDSYPPWGAWMSDTTICYGGEPMVGALPTFEVSDKAAPPDVGETLTRYGGLSEMLPEWWNDVVAMDFRRFCSGDRGNICSGVANRIFQVVTECRDRNTDIGEVESCKGPSTDLISPRQLTSTGTACTSTMSCSDGNVCIDGICYRAESVPTSCTSYDHTTFEKAFGIKRADGAEATGVCNPTWTCSKKEDVYDVTQSSGKYLIKGATCNNHRGNCSEPRPNVEGEEQTIVSCEDYNGRANAINRPEDNDRVCSLNTVKKKLFSQNFTCTEPDEDILCTIVPEEADPDSDEKLCDACLTGSPQHMTTTGVSTTYNPGRADNKKCCGDDAGEGGFPYTATTSGPISAHRKSGLSGAGTYGSEVCDDYYGATYSSANAIDNNCDGNVNCADTSCRVTPGARGATGGWTQYLGPGGSVCCSSNEQCKNFLTPGSVEDLSKNGVFCDANKECDCKPISSNSDFMRGIAYRTVSRSQLPLRLCVANSDEILSQDRHINLTLPAGDSGTHTFRITEQDINGGTDICNGDAVELHVYNNLKMEQGEGQTQNAMRDIGKVASTSGYYFIAFKNTISKDCLVTVTMT